jgi:hypothetical protein
MSADEVTALAEAACALLLSESTGRAKKASAQPTVDEFTSVFADAARLRASEAFVIAALTNYSEEARTAAARVFSSYQPLLVQRLAALSAPTHRLAKVEWELLHALGDRVTVPHSNARSIPEFRFKLQTNAGPVGFVCTAEQLHELAGELQAASASVVRVAKQ